MRLKAGQKYVRDNGVHVIRYTLVRPTREGWVVLATRAVGAPTAFECVHTLHAIAEDTMMTKQEGDSK